MICVPPPPDRRPTRPHTPVRRFHPALSFGPSEAVRQRERLRAAGGPERLHDHRRCRRCRRRTPRRDTNHRYHRGSARRALPIGPACTSRSSGPHMRIVSSNLAIRLYTPTGGRPRSQRPTGPSNPSIILPGRFAVRPTPGRAAKAHLAGSASLPPAHRCGGFRICDGQGSRRCQQDPWG